MRPLLSVAAVLVAAAFLTSSAFARGGTYAFDGGSPLERAQVRAAVEASSFDFDRVPAEVRVHIVPGAWAHATPGDVWLDPALLRAGVFSWAIVQDEFAHQVDYFVLDDADRAVLADALRSPVWCHADAPELDHSRYGCERFTSMLVWAYWQSPANAYRPSSPADESAALPPARFRALLDGLLRRPAWRLLQAD